MCLGNLSSFDKDLLTLTFDSSEVRVSNKISNFCNVSNNVKIDYFDGTECVTLAHKITVIIFNFQLFGGGK